MQGMERTNPVANRPVDARDLAPQPDPLSVADLRQRARHAVLLGAAVALIVYALDWPVLSCQAVVVDDHQYLFDNPLVQDPSWASCRRFFSEVRAPSTVAGYYQPLTMISLMLDFARGEPPDFVRHIHQTNLALHALNTALLVVLLALLFHEPLVAAFSGLLFGLHPLTVEPVAWLSERKTLLATCFACLSLISYVLYVRRRQHAHQVGAVLCYVLTLLTLLLSLLSKPTGIALPALFLVLDYWPLRRLAWRALLEKVPFAFVSAGFAAITFVSQAQTAGLGGPATHGPLWVLLAICHNIGFYLAKILVPADLSVHYPLPEPFDWSAPPIRFGVLLTAVLLLLLLASVRWTRVAIAGGLFFFLAILPTMGIWRVSDVIASNKYAYLPGIGLVLALAGLLTWLWRRHPAPLRRNPARAGILLAVLLLARVEIYGSQRQLAHWRTTETLYREMVRVAPQAPGLWSDLGIELQRQGNPAKAELCFRKAIAVGPRRPEGYMNLALCLECQQRAAEALPVLRDAVAVDPTYAPARYNLGCLLLERGENAAAAEQFAAAVQQKPDAELVWYRIGAQLAQHNQLAAAASYLERALQLNPRLAAAHNDLGLVLARQGQAAAAAEHYRAALRLEPGSAVVRGNLNAALAEPPQSAPATQPR